ncbi:MAG TPA: hypothetical protein VF519_07180 [Mycobacteriales bacterium]|jgi:hypothetical protein
MSRHINALLAAPLVTMALLPGSASADNFVAVDVVSSPSATGPRVTAACKIETPVLQSDGIQFAITGYATALNSNVTPLPLATHVHCALRTISGSWGGPSGDLPGAVAVAAGLSRTVPFGDLGGLHVCAYATAFYQGGITVSSTASPNC